MSMFDHSSSALWQHPLRAVESPEASEPSPQPSTSNLILFVPVYQDWSGEGFLDPPRCLLPPPRLKTFPGPYLCALIQDNFYYLQITGSVTQLPTEASVLLEIDRVSRGQQLGQGQTTAEQVVFMKEDVKRLTQNCLKNCCSWNEKPDHFFCHYNTSTKMLQTY